MGPASRLAARHLLVLIFSFSSLGSVLPVGAADDRLPVTVVLAKQAGVIERIPVLGSLAAKEEVQVHSSIQGQPIEQVLVEVGQFVEKGQALAILDTRDARMMLDKNAVGILRAEAAVSVEASRLDVALVTEAEARKTLERSSALQPKGAVSQQTLDQHQNAYARAVAERSLAQQSLTLARADAGIVVRERNEIELLIERSTIRAPAAGLILLRTASVGAMTSTSAASLFVIARDAVVEFVSQVTETSFVRLRGGMSAEIALSGTQGLVSGTLRLIAARIDPVTRSGEVRIELHAQEGLTPGAFARGSVNASTRRNILLPGSALKTVKGSSRVFVVQDGIVHVRQVTVGARQDGLVEISEGLSDGEMVVLKAGGFLKAQEKVEPVLATSERPDADGVSVSLLTSDAQELAR